MLVGFDNVVAGLNNVLVGFDNVVGGLTMC